MIWVKVDFHSGEPVYKQIVDSIKGDIISGKLPRDEAVPSIRELARDLSINPNTVARAYRDLENEGYIYSRPGVGNFIKHSSREAMEKKALQIISEQVTEIARISKQYGLSRQKFADLVMHISKEVYGGDE